MISQTSGYNDIHAILPCVKTTVAQTRTNAKVPFIVSQLESETYRTLSLCYHLPKPSSRRKTICEIISNSRDYCILGAKLSHA